MKRRNQILVVDDMEINRIILCELFKNDFNTLEADNGLKALEIIKEHKDTIAAILLDIIMPVMDGFQLMEILQKNGILKKIPVILITADTFKENEIKGLTLGASDIIMKPFDPHIVKKRVENSIELYQYKNHLENMVIHQMKKLTETNNFIIDALSTVIEYRNLESGQHIKRIRVFTKTLLNEVANEYPEYELTANTINTISSASAMHDIGKIAIPDSVLLKPGKLTDEEFEIMKTHTTKGCEILKAFHHMENKLYLKYCYEICRHHHERWNGKGYPDGLSGDEIPLCAQVVSIADVYDALTNNRCYKPAIPHDETVKMILEGKCGIFSPKMIKCFKNAADRFKRIADSYSDGLAPDLNDNSLNQPFLNEEYNELNGIEDNQFNAISMKLRQASDVLQKETLERDALINAIPGGVAKISVDNEFKILIATDGFYKLTGYNKAEFHSLPIDGKTRRLILKEDLYNVENKILDSLSEGSPINVEYRIRKKDGTIAWISVHGSQVEVENDIVVVQAVFIDNTIAKNTEQKLSELINTIPGGIVQIQIGSKDEPITYASDGFFELTGYTKEEYINKFSPHNLNDTVYYDDRENLNNYIKNIINNNLNKIFIEFRMIKKDGTIIWCLVNGSKTEQMFKYPCFQCVISDITETKSVQEKLLINEKRYDIIFKQTKDVIFEWDINNDLMYHSSTFFEKFGYELPEKNYFNTVLKTDIYFEDDKPKVIKFMDLIRNGSSYAEEEFRIKNKYKKYIWCRIKATVIFDSMYSPIRAIGIISDIDNYKKENAILTEKAQKDLLTGIYNKITSQTLIEDYIKNEGKNGCHALFVIDIDNFKNINDSFGHLFGDEVLSKISSKIQNNFREYDILGRIGGDEFIIFLKDISSNKLVEKKAKKIINIFHNISEKKTINYKITGSIGISLYPNNGNNFTELFNKADTALYSSKNKGKDCYTIFTDNK